MMAKHDSVADKLEALGYTLPLPEPKKYDPVVISGNLAFVSGHGPRAADGTIACTGQLGIEAHQVDILTRKGSRIKGIVGRLEHLGRLLEDIAVLLLIASQQVGDIGGDRVGVAVEQVVAGDARHVVRTGKRGGSHQGKAA